MKVDDLRAVLQQLVQLLAAAEGKRATLAGLTEFVDLLAPHGALSLKEFMKLAESRPSPGPRPTGRSRGQAPDAESIVVEIKDLYARAAEPGVTDEMIRASCSKLGPLPKLALVQLSEGIGLFGMNSKTKAAIQEAVTARILDRKGAATRRLLLERLPEGSTPAEPRHEPEPHGASEV